MNQSSDVLTADRIVVHFGDETVIVFSRGELIAAFDKDDGNLADGLAQVLKQVHA